jgi:hypothetical protein
MRLESVFVVELRGDLSDIGETRPGDVWEVVVLAGGLKRRQ